MRLALTSPNFEHHAEIPPFHTCEGGDVSPELRWTGVPENAASLALIVDDPDAPDPAAPKRTWVHWVLYDIPPSAAGLRQGVGRDGLPAGVRAGRNSWGNTRYDGPCPPIGRHRYFHKLYALDRLLGDRGALVKIDLEAAMKGHVLASAEIVGTYKKRGGS